jgi:hypothetical protein
VPSSRASRRSIWARAGIASMGRQIARASSSSVRARRSFVAARSSAWASRVRARS